MSESESEKPASIGEPVHLSGRCVAFLERDEFIDVMKRQEEPLLVCSFKGTFRNTYTYLTSYKGLLFAHKTRTPIPLEGYEFINAEAIRFCGRRL